MDLSGTSRSYRYAASHHINYKSFFIWDFSYRRFRVGSSHKVLPIFAQQVVPIRIECSSLLRE
ncbi:hypothetical protein CY34DRAFT_813665 [Suillus luteus UH-Slu-Lm8-n1]|uniref:Unplaced genomic scaffold CY34scaffold_826, whole genome shotgun sequence n=1 Tax=Suillus luteus UH-Slu-Lm8-n1 TaxID=930992 RepID=A0A0C9Z760_9AGAM|nr:hypothetical protein CY34DRAFT_813665 [Suillus luteus UH-Slu-Lm8-n1]